MIAADAQTGARLRDVSPRPQGRLLGDFDYAGRKLARMADRVSAKVRSRIMASVGTRGTGPELAVREALRRHGFRFRTNDTNLPGRPDLVFPQRKRIILVHGCFWHGHRCRGGRLPKSRLDYWKPKIEANRERDRRTVRALRCAGWKVLVVWQCHVRNLACHLPRILGFLRER